MWEDLAEELKAIKGESFGPEYLRIREGGAFEEIENYFLYLVSYIMASQSPSGWWNVTEAFKKLLTAHAVRHLHEMGVPLGARWNLKTNAAADGNLRRAVNLLVSTYPPPDSRQYAKWGDDLWDDCYILLALLRVRTDPEWGDLETQFRRRFSPSLRWLLAQVKAKGFSEKVMRAEWYGPGFYAAAIELFDNPEVKKEIPNHTQVIESLAGSMAACLRRGVRASDDTWVERFEWHVGQCIVMWHRKKDSYPALNELGGVMAELYEILKGRQSENGAWDNQGRLNHREYVIYYTVRALSACYVWEGDKVGDSEVVKNAHRYLLNVARNDENRLLVNLKASVNAIGAFQKLFRFRLPKVFPNLLLLLLSRIDCLGLLGNMLTPAGNEVESLERLRECAKVRLENSGKSALDLPGVNGRLYQSLESNDSFLKEFVTDAPATCRELRKFLSSSLTEVRSRSARRLITSLWTTHGFLNFIPLIDHLSSLEQDRAFYKYYRDHLNHEVLLFLLGAYIYFNSPPFRQSIDHEIRETYAGLPVNLSDEAVEKEFLFRWKLISTFHDVGYLFEVDPAKDDAQGRIRTKEELLGKSFRVVDKVRRAFLFDYFMQYVRVPDADKWNERLQRAATTEEGRRLARQRKAAMIREARRLAQYFGARTDKYGPEITRESDLFELRTGDQRDAFDLMSLHIASPYIGQQFLRNYFDLCRNYDVYDQSGKKQRGPFLDHGIMSALILLKSADIQRFYLKQLFDRYVFNQPHLPGELQMHPRLMSLLNDAKMGDRLNAAHFFVRFSHVAGAIALHNVSPRMYRREQCQDFDAKHNRTGERLEDAFHTEPLGAAGRYAIGLEENPLAYLTTLADMLQDWDRHSFRRISFGETSRDPLASSEVVIDFNQEHRIRVTPLSTTARDRYVDLTGSKGFGDYLLKWQEHLVLNCVSDEDDGES